MARLIDADAVDYENIMCSMAQLHWLNAIIEKQPTIEAVPVVHGEWNIGKFNAGSETVFMECSECAAVFDVPTFVFGLNYNYCPNCGVKMDGGAEDGTD